MKKSIQKFINNKKYLKEELDLKELEIDSLKKEIEIKESQIILDKAEYKKKEDDFYKKLDKMISFLENKKEVIDETIKSEFEYYLLDTEDSKKWIVELSYCPLCGSSSEEYLFESMRLAQLYCYLLTIKGKKFDGNVAHSYCYDEYVREMMM